MLIKVTSVRSMQEIASNLSNSRTSLQTIENGGQTSSMKSLSGSSNVCKFRSFVPVTVDCDLVDLLFLIVRDGDGGRELGDFHLVCMGCEE